MSTVLGQIHFWMYSKIGKQEELTAIVARYAREQGWITDPSVYTRDLPPLESAIDKGNIHGWIQERIHDAESRYAKLILTLAEGQEERLPALYDLAYGFGAKYAIPASMDVTDVYRFFESFFVNGMPCDKINVVTDQREDSLSWEMSRDIHAVYWAGKEDLYYTLRSHIMEGMLKGSPFRLISPDNAHYTIEKTKD